MSLLIGEIIITFLSQIYCRVRRRNISKSHHILGEVTGKNNVPFHSNC